MFKYSNIARHYLKAVKKSNFAFPQVQCAWIDTSRFYASDFKKRGGPVDVIAQRNKANNLNTIKSTNAPLSVPDSCPPKIVQVRAKGTSNEEVPPPSSHTVTEPPGHSRQKPPSIPPPQGGSNTLRNALIGLVVAAATIGGIFYSGILDSSEKVDFLEQDKKNKKGKSRPIERNPKLKEDFPTKVPYLLIGGGTASFAAFRAIKSKDPKAKVLVISAEDSLPYMRPPLSKEIWQQKEIPPPDKLSFRQWNGQERSLFYEPSDFYMDIHELEEAPNGGVTVATGWVASRVDANSNTVEIEDPQTNSTFTIQYDKCLIATGSRPKNLPVFEQASAAVSSRTVLYRNVRDLENLWHRIQGATSVAIVGGGFLGSELACSLARRNNDGSVVKVSQIFKESGNMGRVLPEYLAQWTTDRVREEGVDVVPSVEVLEANSFGNQVLLTLSNGNSVKADVVVVAVGSEPCTQLAETSSLEVDPVVGGFLVNAELEARSNLYAAGDAACFYDPALGRRRVEHHDHAVVSGRLAGENMAGSAKPYKHQSMFWSDLGRDVGYEAIGVIDSCLPTVAVFSKNAGDKSDKAASDASISAESVEGEPANRLTIKNPDTEKPDRQQEEKPVKVEFEGKQAVIKKEVDTDPNQNYNKGIIFYLKKDMVVGIVLWNVFNRMHIARQVLAERRKYDDLNEVAKLFNLHDD